MVYCTPRITGENKRSRSLFSYDVNVFYLEGESRAQSLTLAEGAIAFDLRIQKTRHSVFDQCWMDQVDVALIGIFQTALDALACRPNQTAEGKNRSSHVRHQCCHP